MRSWLSGMSYACIRDTTRNDVTKRLMEHLLLLNSVRIMGHVFVPVSPGLGIYLITVWLMSVRHTQVACAQLLAAVTPPSKQQGHDNFLSWEETSKVASAGKAALLSYLDMCSCSSNQNGGREIKAALFKSLGTVGGAIGADEYRIWHWLQMVRCLLQCFNCCLQPERRVRRAYVIQASCDTFNWMQQNQPL